MTIVGAAPTVRKNVFAQLPGNGGAIRISSNTAGTRIENNTIKDVMHGIVSSLTGPVTGAIVRNNIISWCRGYATYEMTAGLDYNDYWSNVTDYSGGVYKGVHSIVLDPLFADPMLHLSPGSPCIDAGDPNPIYNDSDGTRGDIGAIPHLLMGTRLFGVSVYNEDQTHVRNNAPEFIWHFFHLPDSASQQSYEIEVGDDNDWNVAEQWASGQVISPDSLATYAGAQLFDGQTYFVRVRGSDGVKWTNWSVAEFRMNSVPSGPTVFMPVDGDTVTLQLAQVDVEGAGDAESDNISIDFEVYADAFLANLVSSTTVSASGGAAHWGPISGTFVQRFYWWRVRAFDGFEYSDWSTSHSFFVRPNKVFRVPSEFATIQMAIDATSDGDSVLVAPGVHTGTVRVLDKGLHIFSEFGSDSTRITWPSDLLGFPISFTNARNSYIAGFSVIAPPHSADIRVQDVQLKMRDCKFIAIPPMYNFMVCSGAGQLDISRCVFAHVEAANAMVISAPSMPIIFTYNTVDYTSRAVAAYTSGSVVTNNIFSHCGWGVYDGGTSITEAYNCYYSNSENYPAHLISPTSIDANPQYADPQNFEFGLLPLSPCIDAGDPNLLYNDPDGTRSDIGAITFDHRKPALWSLTLPGEEGNHVLNHSPLITWNAIAPSAGTQVAFEIELGVDADWTLAENWNPETINSFDTSITYSGMPLVDGNTYYTRARVSNGFEWSRWLVNSFRMNTIPNTPLPLSPISGVRASAIPTFWFQNASDTDGDSLLYDIVGHHDSTCPGPILEISGLSPWPDSTGTTFWLTLGENCRYWWKVRAFDGFEYSAWSPFAEFYVDDTPEPPLYPTPLNPPEIPGRPVYDLQPVFQWSKAFDFDPNDTVRYRLEVSENQNFTFVKRIDSLLATSFKFTDSLSFATHYWWKVSAFDRTGLRTYSISSNDFWTWRLGDLNASHTANITDLTFLVAFLLHGGPGPHLRRVADINGDCAVNIVDITYYVSYLFGDGNYPKVGCAP